MKLFINPECENLILKVTSIVKCNYFDKTKATATCFFCQTNENKKILITNKHVFDKCKSADLYITVANINNNLIENRIITLNLGNDIFFHKFYDVCTLDITNIYTDLSQNGLEPQLSFINEKGVLTDYSNLHIIQEVLMLGYPSGIINLSYNHPIIRVGVAATNIKEKYNNQEIFLTDIPTFGGSSGSPIFITDESGMIFLVGINSETFNHRFLTYPKQNKKRNRNKHNGFVKIPNNIGIAINSFVIREMLNLYK